MSEINLRHDAKIGGLTRVMSTAIGNVAFASLALSLLASCVSTGDVPLGVRHEPSGVTLPMPDKNFSQYVVDTRSAMVEAVAEPVARGEIALSDDDIDDRLPFELVPDVPGCEGKPKRGALLIHGLTDSPFLMRDLGERFRDHCFVVRGILLPGHGTVPGDLLDVRYQEWIDAAQAGIDSFEDLDLEELYVGGFSTGGTLSIHYALDEQKVEAARIKGLILLAPAVRPNTPVGLFANWHKTYSWAYKRAQWLDVHLDQDTVKYESFSKNAGDQIHLLTKQLGEPQDSTIPLTVPVFLAMSEDDNSASAEAALALFKNRAPAKSTLVWYMAVPDESNPTVENGKRIIEVKSASEDECTTGCIVDFAHISVPVAPENAHYGHVGTYKSCLHYRHPQGDPEIAAKLVSCESAGDQGITYGENLKDNVEQYTLRRLSYNPRFDEMIDQVFSFIDSLE